jgi:glycerophosphoryl diester phosphodiesterase
MRTGFDLQGHRGARGLKPENTLPSFEAALDIGVTSIETDLHLTRDGEVVLFHDAALSAQLCTPAPAEALLIRSLTLAELRRFRADRNPDPRRFPEQDASVTPLAARFAEQHGIEPYTPPTLGELIAFVQDYRGSTDKTDEQRRTAHQVRLDLELKTVPFHAGDESTLALLEERVVEAYRGSRLSMSVRSFDHRRVLAVRRLEPGVSGAVLIAATAPVHPAELARHADAEIYCPHYQFLDEAQVHQCQAAGVRVLPWTVNDPGDCQRLLAWGVDGITTDYPDQLATLLRQRGIVS